MTTHLCLVANKFPFEHVDGVEPLAEPVVVATLTMDPRVLGGLSAHQQLALLAHKLCLLDFALVADDALGAHTPQLSLPLSSPPRLVRS